MISIKSLVLNTPFDEEIKNKLLNDLETMSSQNKLELEMLCWQTLAEVTVLKFKKEQAKLMYEVSQGKRKYNANDFTETKVRIYHELATKLELGQSVDALDEVRKKLEKHKKSLKTALI